MHYNANGGTITSDEFKLKDNLVHYISNDSKVGQTWTYGSTPTYGLTDCATFGLSKPGYFFKGWGTTATGGTIYSQVDTTISATDLNSYIKTGDCAVTLYAIWEKIELVSDTDAVIDNENGLIFGINEGFENIEDYVSLSADGAEIEFTPNENGNGTGSVVTIVDDGEEIASYTIVIFGDYNGDGIIDTEDTSYFASIANFELFDCYEEGNEHLFMAADINGDGAVDNMDEEDMYAVANFEAYIDQKADGTYRVVRY